MDGVTNSVIYRGSRNYTSLSLRTCGWPVCPLFAPRSRQRTTIVPPILTELCASTYYAPYSARYDTVACEEPRRIAKPAVSCMCIPHIKRSSYSLRRHGLRPAQSSPSLQPTMGATFLKEERSMWHLQLVGSHAPQTNRFPHPMHCHGGDFCHP